ncbi:MAG: hypothetical protein ACJAW3_000931 [Lentimonas sp.]|jgi:hypothetical protein
MIIRPLFSGEGFMFSEMFRGMFLRDIRLTGIFFVILLYGQIVCYFATRSSTKLLQVLDKKLIFTFFNGKILELNYSDVKSLEMTKDSFGQFQFTLKNGEIKTPRTTIKDKQKAFDLITQRIKCPISSKLLQ